MQPIVPGHFSDFTPPDLAPTHNFRLVYDLPAGKPLYADARGFVALPPSTKDGRTRYEFRYDKAHFARLEYGSIAYVSYGDRLMVSTYPDYAAFAAKYRESAVDASGSDPAIVGLARSLTAGDQTPRAKARTLYDWVRKNVRYVAVNIGRGAVVPHRATEILALRYGDCKDHVALYGALLDAVGIRNEPALISSGTIYTLPDVPGYGVLNHVITWLPELQLYADSTAPNVEFGYLPSTDMNRPVVLVNEGVLSRTPSTATMSRTIRRSTRMRCQCPCRRANSSRAGSHTSARRPSSSWPALRLRSGSSAGWRKASTPGRSTSTSSRAARSSRCSISPSFPSDRATSTWVCCSRSGSR